MRDCLLILGGADQGWVISTHAISHNMIIVTAIIVDLPQPIHTGTVSSLSLNCCSVAANFFHRLRCTRYTAANNIVIQSKR